MTDPPSWTSEILPVRDATKSGRFPGAFSLLRFDMLLGLLFFVRSSERTATFKKMAAQPASIQGLPDAEVAADNAISD